MRMKPALTLDDAKKLMAAAEAEATRNKWEVVIAILNDGGRIVAVHRMDGARPGNDQIAIAKATTSAMTCRPSVVWEKWIEGPHKAYATFPFIAAQGFTPMQGTSQQFGDFYRSEAAQWAKVIQTVGITSE
jgi:glc operon protein GlcG